MVCSTCSRVVQLNNTGLCLSCQRGFTGLDAEDAYKTHIKHTKNTDKICEESIKNADIIHLKKRQEEIEDLLEKGGK